MKLFTRRKGRIQASSEKHTLQGKNAFLVLPEEILLDVDVTGLSLPYLVASFLLILSFPPTMIIFLQSYLNSLWLPWSYFLM